MTPARSGRILVIGDVMTDIIVVPEGSIMRGSDRRATIRSRPGGSGANQAVWLGAMGAPVAFVARVGQTDRATYQNYFRGHGVAPLLSGDSTAPSGVLVTIIDPDGERSFLTDRGANLGLCADDLPASLLDDALMVVVSGYTFFADGPREAILGFLAEARQRNIKIVVDPASVGFLLEVGTKAFLEWTGRSSLIFANLDEAQTLTGSDHLDTQMQRLGEHFERVVIKRGALGAAIGGRDGVSLSLPAPAAKVVDSTGAGDAFAAGFLSAEVKGADAEACLKAGIAAGAEAVKQIGGQPGR